MKTLIFSVIAIYGRDVPAFDKYEDIKAIALNLIHKLSGVEVIDSQVKDCHRLGKKILVSFVYAGACSPINEIVYDKKAMHKAATWINIHQCPHDRYIAFVARRMKKAGILSFVGTTFGSLTRVGQNGQKYTINSGRFSAADKPAPFPFPKRGCRIKRFCYYSVSKRSG